MTNAYFLSSDLDELEQTQIELCKHGLSDADIKVWSEESADVEHHHLHNLDDISKTNVVSAMSKGAVVGFVASSLIIVCSLLLGLDQSVYFVPMVFLAVMVFGFCIWEAGLIGAHNINQKFPHLKSKLKAKQHILILSFSPSQKVAIETVLRNHPRIMPVSA
jgi:hypothetical protein